MNAQHLGSDFDDFLDTEGLRSEVEATARKRVFDHLALSECIHDAFPPEMRQKNAPECAFK